ncbi:MAG: Gfo/Idh/MocA family protein [Thermoguttaceae bacterium]
MKKQTNSDGTSSSAKMAALGAITAGLSWARSVHASGSETIKIGLVGCGGRGRGAAYNALKNATVPHVKLVALADAFKNMIDGTVQLLGDEFPGKIDVPEERRFAGLDCCERLLETDVDVVLLCEPPGFRPRHFVAAVDAGKHVFAEKPVATDAPGVRMFLKAGQKAKENGKVVCVGHHLRFEPKHVESIDRIHQGEIGDLLYMKIFFNDAGVWTRPRTGGQTEMQHQVSNWYYFNWLSGDHIVEQHVHDIDVMNWIAGDRHPIEANGMGGRSVRIGPQYGEIFDHHSVEYKFDDQVTGFSNCRHIPNCWNSFSEHAYGSKGHVDMDGHGRVTLYAKGKEPVSWERTYDGHQTEMDVMFDAIANSKEMNLAERGAIATLTAIMGRMASYSGRVVKWEDALNSNVDLFPKSLSWDADPGPKPDVEGIYPCAQQGITVEW